MRTRTRGSGPILLSLAAAAAVAAVPAAASASTQAFPVVGHVFVNDNTAATNTIGGFDRHADGTLTPEAGSPFAAGGALFVDESRIGAVAAFAVNGGNLTELAGSPTSLPAGPSAAMVMKQPRPRPAARAGGKHEHHVRARRMPIASGR